VALVLALFVEAWEDSVIACPLQLYAGQYLLMLVWLELELSTESHGSQLGQ
jgi:hypothetical protein